jgi:probable HAF family extracellular repeat protein
MPTCFFIEALEERSLPSNYSFSELLPLSGQTYQRVYDINQVGQVVGTSRGTQTQLALWQPDGQGFALTNTLGTTAFDNAAAATGINDSGSVVGYFLPAAPGSYHAFLWTPNIPNGPSGSMIDLGFAVTAANDPRGGPTRINNQGVVIGNQQDSADTRLYPFVWQNGASMNLNQLLPAGSGWDLHSANGINATEIVGQGVLNGTTQAYLYVDDDGNFLNGGGQVYALPGVDANAISSNGKVAGDLADRGFVWTPTVPNGTAGTLSVGLWHPHAINDSGDVVGNPNGVPYVLFAGATTAQNLNSWRQGQATPLVQTWGITDTGVILAEDINYYAYRLTPSATALPVLSIGAVSKAEGNSGTTAFVFTVSLSAPSTSAVTFSYFTQDGTAVSSGSSADYQAVPQAQRATLTFAPGETSKSFTILVYGDKVKEKNETFVVQLWDVLGAIIANAGNATGTKATGTILNDD